MSQKEIGLSPGRFIHPVTVGKDVGDSHFADTPQKQVEQLLPIPVEIIIRIPVFQPESQIVLEYPATHCDNAGGDSLDGHYQIFDIIVVGTEKRRNTNPS